MFIRYFLGNGIIFASKIGKNINSIQVNFPFFPFSLEICDKKAAEHENMNFMLNGFYCLNPNDFCIEYQTFPGFTSSLLV